MGASFGSHDLGALKMKNKDRAEKESYNVLWSDLYSALEADISFLKYPPDISLLFTTVTEDMEMLLKDVEEALKAYKV
jgi:hypothetical protein